MIKQGTWSLYSKKDLRWNCSGKCLVGGFVMPEPCKEKIEALTIKLGPPPDDLEWGYFKD